MLYFYLTVETLLYAFMISSTLFISKKIVVHVSRFLPIAFDLLFVYDKDVDWRIKLALFMSVCADICFLFLKNLNVGVVFYQLVQLEYYAYLNGHNFSLLGIIVFVNMIWAIIMKREVVCGAISYAALTIVNLFNSRKESILKYGVRLLAFCDSCIVWKMIFKKKRFLNKLFDLLEWMAYIPSQICTVLCGLKKNYAVAV